MTRQRSMFFQAGTSRGLGRAALLTLTALSLTGCGGSMLGGSSISESPIGSRFSQLFGSKSQAVGEPAAPTAAEQAADTQLTCPPVAIRAGASTLAVGLPGKPASGADLRYQVTITRTARDCNLNGGQITARIGIEGRVIVGPAGAPPTVDIPVRVAVVQEGVGDKVIFTKAYRSSVAMADSSDSTVYSFVAEDVIYPPPKGDANDQYVFYIGFDPSGVKPEAAPRRHRKHRGEQG